MGDLESPASELRTNMADDIKHLRRVAPRKLEIKLDVWISAANEGPPFNSEGNTCMGRDCGMMSY